MARLSIGDFAQASGLPPKALRLYDELGLLPPSDVDPRSGCRAEQAVLHRPPKASSWGSVHNVSTQRPPGWGFQGLQRRPVGPGRRAPHRREPGRPQRVAGSAERHPGEYHLCLGEDFRFHEIVTRSCGNPFFSWFMAPVNTCLRESYKNERAYLASLPRTFAEHRAILDAITAGDAAAARRNSRQHLNRVISQQESLVTPGDEP